MKSEATSPEAYIEQIPESRREAFCELRQTILTHLPAGYEEAMSYGMIGYVVPHGLYPSGYHCNPALPLPFINIANQKGFIALYHMGLYADPELLEWFQKEYVLQCPRKLDMGKSCVRFKNPSQIPMGLIGELSAKMTPLDWIARYEKMKQK